MAKPVRVWDGTAWQDLTTQLQDLSAYVTKASPSVLNAILNGTTTINEVEEIVTVSATAANGTVNYDFLNNHGVTFYTTAATGNWTLNIRGNSTTTLNSRLEVGQALTIVFMVTNGATAYYQTGFQIDGVAVTPKWTNGSAPTAGNTNSIDVYSFTIIKTASATYTILGSLVKFA